MKELFKYQNMFTSKIIEEYLKERGVDVKEYADNDINEESLFLSADGDYQEFFRIYSKLIVTDLAKFGHEVGFNGDPDLNFLCLLANLDKCKFKKSNGKGKTKLLRLQKLNKAFSDEFGKYVSARNHELYSLYLDLFKVELADKFTMSGFELIDEVKKELGAKFLVINAIILENLMVDGYDLIKIPRLSNYEKISDVINYKSS